MNKLNQLNNMSIFKRGLRFFYFDRSCFLVVLVYLVHSAYSAYSVYLVYSVIRFMHFIYSNPPLPAKKFFFKGKKAKYNAYYIE